jgi:protocatechuate 3,4-dioxygenase beta subunit
MHDHHSHDHGLLHDLTQLGRMGDRSLALSWLGLLGDAGLVPAVALAQPMPPRGPGRPGTPGGTPPGSGSGSSSCTLIPEETAGPYPGDGSNTANGQIATALMLSGIVRSDIRSSIAGATGTAAGVPLKVVIKLVNANAQCAALSGYAIYLWHCDAQGRYSMYSSGITDQNYLRGVQVSDSGGSVTFQTIFPGCYSGRMPHMHFEVYRDANTATSFSNKLRTSQLAFPVATCQEVYNGSSLYSASITNLARISFATDMVFSDGVTQEMTTLTGNASTGYVATITVAISV